MQNKILFKTIMAMCLISTTVGHAQITSIDILYKKLSNGVILCHCIFGDFHEHLIKDKDKKNKGRKRTKMEAKRRQAFVTAEREVIAAAVKKTKAHVLVEDSKDYHNIFSILSPELINQKKSTQTQHIINSTKKIRLPKRRSTIRYLCNDFGNIGIPIENIEYRQYLRTSQKNLTQQLLALNAHKKIVASITEKVNKHKHVHMLKKIIKEIQTQTRKEINRHNKISQDYKKLMEYSWLNDIATIMKLLDKEDAEKGKKSTPKIIYTFVIVGKSHAKTVQNALKKYFYYESTEPQDPLTIKNQIDSATHEIMYKFDQNYKKSWDKKIELSYIKRYQNLCEDLKEDPLFFLLPYEEKDHDKEVPDMRKGATIDIHKAISYKVNRSPMKKRIKSYRL